MKTAIFVLVVAIGGRLLRLFPVWLFVAVGAFWNCHWTWITGIAVAYFVHAGVSSVASGRVAIEQTLDAVNDFLDKQDTCVLLPYDASKIVDEAELGPWFNIRMWQQWKGRPIHPGYDAKTIVPLYCYVVRKVDGDRIIRSSRAYVNAHGRSFIFLECPPEQLGDIGQFMLNHEIEHVVLRGGSWQAENLQELPRLNAAASILLCVAASHWIHIAATLLVAVLRDIYSRVFPSMYREILADNGAARRLQDGEKRLTTLNKVVELFDDYAETAHGGLERYSWRLRSRYLKRARLVCAMTGECPRLHWSDGDSLFLGWCLCGIAAWIAIERAQLPWAFFIIAVLIILERNMLAIRQWGVVHSLNALVQTKLEKAGLASPLGGQQSQAYDAPSGAD